MSSAIVPIPRIPLTIRAATPQDVPFIDALQKLHNRQVGFMHMKTLEGKIAAGEVLIAMNLPSPAGRGQGEGASAGGGAPFATPTCPHPDPLPEGEGVAVGYVIGVDRYFKRDDVGIIYHLNVAPGAQRGFVGMTLLKAMFDRAAYGCRLFCCWCAQDIEANRFWEAMGFVPLAFRAGSARKGRVHIFWQKRIRAGDTSTAWWFPSQTTGGSIREDRLVLPIPPGTHWSDAKPIVLPGVNEPRRIEGPVPKKDVSAPKPKPKRQTLSRASTLQFEAPAPPVAEKKLKVREPKRKVKNDPKLIAAARELRDRWLERVNAGDACLTDEAGKYDLTRALPDAPSKPVLALPAAA